MKMDFKKQQVKQVIRALNETKHALQYCLKYRKTTNSGWNPQDNGCLGYPSLILLSSIIDTMGAFLRGSKTQIPFPDGSVESIETVSNHFYILNNQTYFDLKLPGTAINDFYSTYRSKMTHNHALPLNNIIYYDESDTKEFSLNSEGKVSSINIFALYQVTKEALDKFVHHLQYSTLSDDHKVTKELMKSGKVYEANTPTSISSSGEINPDYNPDAYK